MRNWILCAGLAIAAAVFALQSHAQTNDEDTAGFCFADGRYLQPPYAVTVKENVVQVNGVPVGPRLPSEELAQFNKQRLEGNLGHREVSLCFTQSGHIIAPGLNWTKRNLKLMVDILASDRTAEQKVSLLQRIDLLPLSWNENKTPLVTGFTPSKNLADRVNALIAAKRLDDRRIEDIPDEPAILTERRLKLKSLGK